MLRSVISICSITSRSLTNLTPKPAIAKLASHQNLSARSTARGFSTTSYLFQRVVVKVPPMAESISEGTLSSFTRCVGDSVEADEEIASIETDKIDVSVITVESGTIVELLVNEGDTVTVGQEVAVVETESVQTSSTKSDADSGANMNSNQDSISATKETSNSAAANIQHPTSIVEPKQNLQPLEQIESETPVEHTRSQPTSSEENKQTLQSSTSSSSGSGTTNSKFSRAEHRVKMNRMRMRISERLKQSQNTAASLTTFNEVDMSAVIALRKRYKDDIMDKHGVRLGFMSLFAKAASLALQDIPIANASIEGSDGGDTIVFRDYVDISIAVSIPKGLVTPVLRNCESLDVVEMEKRIAQMAEKARDGKMTIEDMAGGSFTISNGGVFGSMMGTPIINLPQTAVLGMHSITDRAVVVDGKIEVRPMMYLALTYDHRLLDGRESVQFLVAVKKYLEDPAKMLLR